MKIVQPVDQAHPLRQADVFASLDGTQLGIIVTADCDIAQEKSWSTIQWIPIVSCESYLCARWAFESIGTRVTRICDQLLLKINRLRSTAGRSEIDNAAIVDALDAGDTESILELLQDLGEDDPNHANSLAKVAAAKLFLKEAPPRFVQWPSDVANRCLHVLDSLMSIENAKLSNELDRMSNRLRSGSTPGDIFIIPQNVRAMCTGTPDSLHEPHVALLRFLRADPLEQFATDIGRARASRATYYRFAQLQSPYRYDLTRRLGSVFADIGFPEEYDDHTKRVIGDLATTIKQRAISLDPKAGAQ